MIGGMLASGGIVTTAAILRLYFTLKGMNHLQQAILWAVRESVSCSISVFCYLFVRKTNTYQVRRHFCRQPQSYTAPLFSFKMDQIGQLLLHSQPQF